MAITAVLAPAWHR